jgi:regulator of extracellular matrix RemA (YlzA/DUF370 family)
MKNIILILTTTFTLFAFGTYAQPSDIPNQEPGKCYAKSMVQDEYQNQSEIIVVKEATKRVEVIPAVYGTESEKVMVKAGAERIETKPALYTTVTEKYRVGCPDGFMDGLAAGGGVDECYKMVPVPATYKDVFETYVVKEASTRIVTKPAIYKEQTQTVIVKEATTRLEVIPAVYGTRTIDNVLMEAASSYIEQMPVPYATTTKTVVTRPASSKWIKKIADENCLSIDPNDCLVWSFVEVPEESQRITVQVMGNCPDGWTQVGEQCTREVVIPAKYGSRTESVVVTPATTREVFVPQETKTITTKVLVSPATEEVVIVPEETRTITRSVVDKPATTTKETIAPIYKEYTKKVRTGCPDGYRWANPNSPSDDCIKVMAIPAQYGTFSKKIVSSPAAIRTIEVPQETRTVTKKILVKPGGYTVWREVLCSGDVTPALVQQIQSALVARGFNVGATGSDNLLGPNTKAALIKFQNENGLPVGSLDFETLKALGINL